MADIEKILDAVPVAHMTDAVERYLLHGIEGGGFLTAVLANDLKGAAGRADVTNLGNLHAWAGWLYNSCPPAAQGSYEKVEAWCRSGGMKGLTGTPGPASPGPLPPTETPNA